MELEDIMTRTSTSLAGAFVTAVALAVSTDGVAAQGNEIQGTWIAQVRLLTACSGGTPLAPFWSVLIFANGGTLAGSTMNAAFAPGQRGPDHGTWTPAAGGGVTASSVALLSFSSAPSPPQSPGFQAGAQRIDQTITMSGRDSFSSSARVTFLDLNGVVYRQGCAVATGWRFQ
jgi:hypothetical protein